jgi:hypothetical protein
MFKKALMALESFDHLSGRHETLLSGVTYHDGNGIGD